MKFLIQYLLNIIMSQSVKEFSESKFNRQVHHKRIASRFLDNCPEHMKDKFNNPYSYTGADGKIVN